MNLRHFNSLNNRDKAYEISEHAVYLMDRADGCYKIHLYQIGNFYLELFEDGKTFNGDFFMTFDRTEKLEPYLLKIDISGLL